MKTIYAFLFIILLTSGNVFSQEIVIPEPEVDHDYVVQIKEQDEQKILSRISLQLKNELLKVKEVDKERYKDLLRECASGIYVYDGYLGYMESFEKEQFEAEKKINELELLTESLGIRYEYASESDKQKIVTDLKSNLNELFDAKEKSRSLQVQVLEKELVQLKESLRVRKQNKNEIINRRLNELIGKGDYLDW